MKVYVVIHDYCNEDAEILGVFATRDAARSAVRSKWPNARLERDDSDPNRPVNVDRPEQVEWYFVLPDRNLDNIMIEEHEVLG
jgi:hypothetical protein